MRPCLHEDVEDGHAYHCGCLEFELDEQENEGWI